jgi:hypothetical protein
MSNLFAVNPSRKQRMHAFRGENHSLLPIHVARKAMALKAFGGGSFWRRAAAAMGIAGEDRLLLPESFAGLAFAAKAFAVQNVR